MKPGYTFDHNGCVYNSEGISVGKNISIYINEWEELNMIDDTMDPMSEIKIYGKKDLNGNYICHNDISHSFIGGKSYCDLCGKQKQYMDQQQLDAYTNFCNDPSNRNYNALMSYQNNSKLSIFEDENDMNDDDGDDDDIEY